MSEMFNEVAKVPQKTQTCPAVGIQKATVCLPVKVSPYSVSGPVKMQCCGEPIILPSCSHCHGKVNGSCEFTISQKIQVEIPVEFGATVCIGDTFVECGCTKSEEPDRGCNRCHQPDDDCK